MKVVAFNASPKMEKSNTSMILNPFIEGIKKAGAEVELFYTKKLKIKPCCGEFHCWIKTPGKCFQNDDMQMLYPKIREADIWVLGTPLYVDGITGPIKNLLDRILPFAEPSFELRNGHCRHPVRKGIKRGKVVLISNCGFWEVDNFDPMLAHVKAICKNADKEFVGALLRPHGGALQPMIKMGIDIDDIFRAAYQAGFRLIQDGTIPVETLKIVSRQLLPLELYMQFVNTYFNQELAALNKEVSP